MQSLFERTVFRSSESKYEPHTFTMYVYRPYLEIPLGSAILHEIMHWIQYIAYTFGGFLSASIHMRDELSKQILIKYANSKDDYQRHQVQFSMPGDNAFFNFHFDHECMEQDVLRHQIAWRDGLICEKLFLRMSKYYEDGKGYKGVSSVHEILKPELLIPRTLVRMNNWATGTLGYRSTEPQGYLLKVYRLRG